MLNHRLKVQDDMLFGSRLAAYIRIRMWMQPSFMAHILGKSEDGDDQSHETLTRVRIIHSH